MPENMKRLEHLQFLHKNSQVQGLYESMGIEGYDGLIVTDRKKFVVECQEKSPSALIWNCSMAWNFSES